MHTKETIESPLVQVISFDKLLKRYDAAAHDENSFMAEKARRILKAAEPFPELREGFSDVALLDKFHDTIHIILQDVFSEVLTDNEIKTASLPFDNIVYNSSARFKKILQEAGDDFVLEMRQLPGEQMYIMACTVILNFHYGFHLDFRRPFFYDIPDKNGVIRHYRILYNADFMEILPTEKAKDLTREDVDELLENFDDIRLWKEKFPPNSFISKGFVISNMFDVTAEHSISEIKSSLIASDKRQSKSFITKLEETFKSFFNLPNITVGFITYNPKENRFEKVPGIGIESLILQ